MLGQQLFAGRGLQPGEAQGAHERAAALQGAQGGGLLPAGQQQATLVRRLGYLPQQMLVRFKARTQMPPHLAFFQQHFQVIEHQQHSPAAQFPQQQAQAPLQALGQESQRLGGEHQETRLQQRFTGGGVAQGAKEHHLKVPRQLPHGAHRQRRLADAAHAQRAHQPTALLDHPTRQRRQFLLAIIEAGHRQRLPPIQSWSWRRLSRGQLTWSRGLQRHRGQQGQRRMRAAEQAYKPGFIEQHLLVCRLPEGTDLLFLASKGKG